MPICLVFCLSFKRRGFYSAFQPGQSHNFEVPLRGRQVRNSALTFQPWPWGLKEGGVAWAAKLWHLFVPMVALTHACLIIVLHMPLSRLCFYFLEVYTAYSPNVAFLRGYVCACVCRTVQCLWRGPSSGEHRDTARPVLHQPFNGANDALARNGRCVVAMTKPWHCLVFVMVVFIAKTLACAIITFESPCLSSLHTYPLSCSCPFVLLLPYWYRRSYCSP